MMDMPSIGGGSGGTSLSGGTSGTGPTTSGPATATAQFNNSGWTVSTGSSKASAASTPVAGLFGAPGSIPWIPLAIAAVIGLIIWKRMG